MKYARYLLLAFCIIGWVWFFNGAHWTHDDWTKEINYLSILKQSITTGTIPWHTDQVVQITDRFLTLPETCLSPQILLLGIFKPTTFIVFNTLIMSTIGFFGCVKLAKRYDLSFIGLATMVLLLNFNGCMTSRLAVGHFMWLSLFYTPWFYLYLTDVMDERPHAGYKLGSVLFLVLLGGGIHQFIWMSLFALIAGCYHYKRLKAVFAIVLFTSLASAYRILPAMWQNHNLQHPFMTGYPTLNVMAMAFTSILPHNVQAMGGMFIPCEWHEFDMYVGIVGLILLAYGLTKGDGWRWPALTMFGLCFGDVWAILCNSGLPLANAEAVSSRFIWLPFFFVLIAALKRLNPGWKYSALLLVICAELYQHAVVWRPVAIEHLTPIHVANAVIANHPDRAYMHVVIGSFILSATALTLIIESWYGNRRRMANTGCVPGHPCDIFKPTGGHWCRCHKAHKPSHCPHAT